MVKGARRRHHSDRRVSLGDATSWIDGHFYSVKAPGLSLLVTPPYLR